MITSSWFGWLWQPLEAEIGAVVGPDIKQRAGTSTETVSYNGGNKQTNKQSLGTWDSHDRPPSLDLEVRGETHLTSKKDDVITRHGLNHLQKITASTSASLRKLYCVPGKNCSTCATDGDFCNNGGTCFNISGEIHCICPPGIQPALNVQWITRSFTALSAHFK